MPPVLSVIIPTHNPHLGRLQRALSGLRDQTLSASEWETLLVDNASQPSVRLESLADFSPANLRVVMEPKLGLTSARRRGFTEARAEVAVLVDDDNVLAPDYLARVLASFAEHPRVGAIGGKSLPEFEAEPEEWMREFFPLLALRDLGPGELISTGLRPPNATRNEYPAFAPIGAGMGLRRAAFTAWLDAQKSPGANLSDRCGTELSSGGDNDIVLCVLRAGWEVGYFPGLSLTHLIPAGRLDASYLARLNRGIQKSWMQVLAVHDASPWPRLTPAGAAFRKFKAWFGYRAWASPAAQVRWQGACGHFDGRAAA